MKLKPSLEFNEMKNATLIFFFLFFTTNLSAQQFSKEEKKLIQSGNSNTMMKVIQVTDEKELTILKTASSDVHVKDKLLPLLAERMFRSMRDPANPGIGIAAPQIGINKNVFWVQRFDKVGEPFEFFLNPKIVWRSSLLRKGTEGCLSIPDFSSEVLRNYTIKIIYWNLEGEYFEEIVEGFTAVVFQHEHDHLNGILFTDRLKEQNEIDFSKVQVDGNLYLKEKLRRP